MGAGTYRLKCKCCRYKNISTGFIVHPSGWYERGPSFCECIYLDKLGFPLRGDDTIFTSMDPLRTTLLNVDYVVSSSYVKFQCVHDGKYLTDDNGPSLGSSDVVRVAAFCKLRRYVQHWQEGRDLRIRCSFFQNPLLPFLRLCSIQRLLCSCKFFVKENTSGMRCDVYLFYDMWVSVLGRLLGRKIAPSISNCENGDWKRYRCGENRVWLWNRRSLECFYEDTSGPWCKYYDASNCFWWWHPSARWFYER